MTNPNLTENEFTADLGLDPCNSSVLRISITSMGDHYTGQLSCYYFGQVMCY
jgi:hypothetical protein